MKGSISVYFYSSFTSEDNYIQPIGEIGNEKDRECVSLFSYLQTIIQNIEFMSDRGWKSDQQSRDQGLDYESDHSRVSISFYLGHRKRTPLKTCIFQPKPERSPCVVSCVRRGSMTEVFHVLIRGGFRVTRFMSLQCYQATVWSLLNGIRGWDPRSQSRAR